MMPRDQLIGGCDEVGTGAWSGPIVAAVVVAPTAWTAEFIVDSKRLTPAKRERALQTIKAAPDVHSFCAQVPVEEINRLGLAKAHRALVQQLVDYAYLFTESIVVDGALSFTHARSVPRADATIPVVSAASIVAKVTRDHMMATFDTLYPGYDFAKNKGYGSRQHAVALARCGPCALHRLGYAPIVALLDAIQAGTVTTWQTKYQETLGSTG